MISKLRKKIIAINVISVCIVFLAAEVSMFAIGFNRIDSERGVRVVAAFDFDYENDDFASNKMFNDLALIVYDKQAEQVVYSVIGKGAETIQEKLDKGLDRIIRSDSDSGWLLTWRIRYNKRTDGSIVKIVFSNSYLRGGNIPYLIISGGTLLLGVASYMIISLMLARIALKPVEESWDKQRQFVADASHELKTPLSVIMANTDIVASHQDETVESQMKWIDNTREEAKRMAALVADLLFLAKDDDGMRVQMDKINLSDCIETAALGFDAVFYENGKDFRYEIAKNVKVFGNDGQLKQLITILLDNASKYSVGQGNIFLSLTVTNKRIVITVSNDSDELTDENIEHLFDRFYTVDKSRNSDKGGNGLGLSIAKTIAVNHGGDLSVEYRDGRTTFTVELPAYRHKKDNNG